MYKIIKNRLKIDLLAAKNKSREGKEITPSVEILSFIHDIKISPAAVFLGLFILGGTFAWGHYRLTPLKKELEELLSIRPAVKSVNPDSSYTELDRLGIEYRKKVEAMNSMIKKHTYITEQLEIIPGAVPEGVWLTAYSFRKDDNKAELTLKGVAYMGDNDKEMQLINTFVSNLKESAKFSKSYKDISILGIERAEIAKSTVSGFTIICADRKGRR